MKQGSLLLGVICAAGLGAIWTTAAIGQSKPARVAKPKPVEATNVGNRLNSIRVQDLDGKTVSIPDSGAAWTVVALTSTTCPICLKYGPSLARLEQRYANHNVKFVFVNPSEEPRGDMQSMRKRLGLKGAYIHDADQAIVQDLEAVTTAEVFVLDPKGQIRYRGAVDDQYAIGASLPKPRNAYLTQALDALLAGGKPRVAATDAPGCLLNSAPEAGVAKATFNGNIRSMIDKHCLSCHRPGGVAPFTLDSYSAVKSRGKMLQFVMQEKIMPPWFADDAKAKSPWLNERAMDPAEIAQFSEWVEAGMPEGPANPTYKAPTFPVGWTMGKPDAIFQIPKPIPVKESGTMPYQNVVVETGFTEDRWVTGIEVMPTNLSVVHHALVFVGDGSSRRLGGGLSDDEFDEISGFFGIYVPGNSALVYRDGLAKRIPKGSKLRFQIHYTPNGTATTDQTRIGLIFAKQPPKQEVHTASLVNLQFVIPANAPNHEVKAQMRIPTDVEILSFLPHMHVRGKAARYELVDASGKRSTLLNVPRYDFNWQLNYVYREPKKLTTGQSLVYTAWYDNSEANPANPDPKRNVGWGLQTADEMHLGYLEYIVPGEQPGTTSGPLRNRGIVLGNSNFVVSTFERLDRNKDGFVTENEARLMWNRIKAADANGDGKITLEEAKSHFGS